MKNYKLNIFLIVVIFVFVLGGCTGKNYNSDKTDSLPSPEETNETAATYVDSEIETVETVTVSWEEFLVDVSENRDWGAIFDFAAPKINTDEYIKNSTYEFEGGLLSTQNINDVYGAYLADFDKDNIEELYVQWCEGSIRHCFIEVYKLENNTYVYQETSEGDIFPVIYNNELHYISIDIDFQTKFVCSIAEYDLKGYAFKIKEIIKIQYIYDTSGLTENISEMLNDGYLNSLDSYEISSSNIAEIDHQDKTIYTYEVALPDQKNNHIYEFTLKLWLTSVGYFPNYWSIEANDIYTSNLKDINIITTSENILYGIKFYKDSKDDVYILKVSYPLDVVARKDGNLIVQLFMFNNDSILEIENDVVEPSVVLNWS